MKRALSFVVLLLAMAVPTMSADADVFVRGYFKNNGTYVQPHYRTRPDGLGYNNYSYTPPKWSFGSGYSSPKRFNLPSLPKLPSMKSYRRNYNFYNGNRRW